jgi:hypothetical protein
MSRKHCKRVHHTPTVNPLVFKLEASAEQNGKVTQWRVELARIVNLIKAGEFSHAEANRVHDFLSTCFVIARMSRRNDVYDYVGEAAECFLAMLRRRRELDKWVATGDEVKILGTHMDALAEAIGALPETTIKIAMARAEVELQQVRRMMVQRKEIKS